VSGSPSRFFQTLIHGPQYGGIVRHEGDEVGNAEQVDDAGKDIRVLVAATNAE